MSEPATQVWRTGPTRSIMLDQPRLMGVVNVTPDSFSDGGMFGSVMDAVEYGLRLVEQGASIIDIGGESTRPGSKPVPPAEQIRRTIPVIRGMRSRLQKHYRGAELPHISIDTTRAAVAQAALENGAEIINDISAGVDDQAMLPLAASRACGIILMHRRTAPAQDHYSDRHPTPPSYGDVVHDVREFLAQRIEAAIAAGIARSAIVIDPGLGFGKNVKQNYELIARTCELMSLGCPLLSAASRKSFLGAASGGSTPVGRVIASTAVSVHHALQGVRLFRVHDVAAHREALAVAAAIGGGHAANQPCIDR
jgi:dihydropteroate synthase